MRRFIHMLVILALCATIRSTAAAELSAGVRGVATRAPANMKIDGDLAEFSRAFGTPVEYFHTDWKNRAAQFFYMWDDEAFYAGLRTLDQKQANRAPDDRLWEGDGVEWYFDTRRGPGFRNAKWEAGAVHCYWTGYKDDAISPRFCLRPGYLDAIPKTGVQVAARKTAHGAEVEFKLPWVNFPDFQARLGEVIAVDAELCYSDGGPRVYRTFAYGSPLSVQQPASLAPVQLVDQLEFADWKACGPVMMPIRIDTPWNQSTKAHAYGSMALPPNHLNDVGRIVFRLTGLDGQMLGEYEAEREVLQDEGQFARATAHWPTDVAPPGRYQVMAVVFDPAGRELTRVAPRLVSVNMTPGY